MVIPMKTQNKSYGNAGEERAVAFLKEEGYQILQRNFRCRQGEIDIVAMDKEYLCFVEVKRRRTPTSGHPFEAISPAKIRHICKTALVYLNMHRLSQDTAIRFDVVAILEEEISLLKNAFPFVNL